MQFFKSDPTEPVAMDQLPRLVILTGVNGSGKTIGMKSLQSSDSDGTQYIDYQNFAASWSGSPYLSHNPQGDTVLRDSINNWKFPPAQPGFLGQSLHPLWGVKENSQLVDWIEKSCTASNFARLAWSFFELFPEARHSSFEEHSKLLSEDSARAQKYWNGFGDQVIPCAYRDASQKHSKPVHCLTDEEVTQSLDQLQRLKNPLYCDLISIVADYLERRNQRLYEDWQKGIDFQSAAQAFRQQNPNPFEHINKILERIADNQTGVFQFSVSSNIPDLPATYKDLKVLDPSVELKLQHTKTGEPRNLDQLSSGERTLLALATLLYTHKYVQPMRAIYLDEIDASLHPSMIESMLEILQEQSGRTRIFLATHSPSTVALADEDSLFLVHDGKAVKTNKTKALESLTQGYFTTEGISSVVRSIKVIDEKVNTFVISEGKNVAYLVPILKALGYDNQIHVHEWANPGGKGTENLRPLMSLFAEMIITGPRKIVFLFDCDADPSKYTKNTEHVIGVFLKNQPNYVERGIENIIPDEILQNLGNDIYGKSNGQNVVKADNKDEVKNRFLDELKANKVDLDLMRKVLKDLLDLCPKQ